MSGQGLFSAAVVAVVVGVVGCGGKIAGDAEGGEASSSSGSSGASWSPPVPSPEPSPPPPPARPSRDEKDLSLERACAIICERNGKCGADKMDCVDDCVAEGRSACGAEATAYRQCHGAHIDDTSCVALPPVCEPAYCAYTRCTGIYTPPYCF
ncbi:MAG: hypothetical protein KF819_12560 [Labilithrix sp.]|nr:hypothetical protein [Labilithrix sp.]